MVGTLKAHPVQTPGGREEARPAGGRRLGRRVGGDSAVGGGGAEETWPAEGVENVVLSRVGLGHGGSGGNKAPASASPAIPPRAASFAQPALDEKARRRAEIDSGRDPSRPDPSPDPIQGASKLTWPAGGVESLVLSRVGNSYGSSSRRKAHPSTSTMIPPGAASFVQPALDEKACWRAEIDGGRDPSRPNPSPDPIQGASKLRRELGSHSKESPLRNPNPLRVFTHAGQQRFHVIFSLHVHGIQDIPPAVAGLRLTVHWKRKEEGVQTMPSQVFQGVARFEETLRQRCVVYASNNGPNSTIKYEPKFFTLSVIALDADEVELGKHHLDLSQLLPQYPHDHYEPSSWTTSFGLTGRAGGASLRVTFGFDLVHHDFSEGITGFEDASEFNQLNNLQNSSCERHELEHLSLGSEGGQVQVVEEEGHDYTSTVDPSTVCESKPISKFHSHDESATPALLQHSSPQPRGDFCKYRDDGFDGAAEFVIQEKGAELGLFPWSSVKTLEKHGTSILSKHIELESCEFSLHDKEGMTENFVNTDKLEGDGFPKDVTNYDVVEGCSKSNLQEDFMRLDEWTLDEEVEQVAGDFLKMYGKNVGDFLSGSESASPKAVILEEFEQENVHRGGIAFDIDMKKASKINTSKPYVASPEEATSANWEFQEDLELASIIEATESELQKAKQTFLSKTRAKMLEDAETEALMQQWGLSEKAFESSPPKCTQAFCYPMQPPPLAPGLGSVIRLREGGSLRSMSPVHFHNSKSNGRLVMQVSRPVVVPTKSGVSAVDILRHLAAFGMENMALQAIDAMPLDDITGKSMEEIAGANFLEGDLSYFEHTASTSNRYPSLDADEPQRNFSGHVKTNTMIGLKELQSPGNPALLPSLRGINQQNSVASDECVFLDDLAPLAMQNIEALAIDGLKIQSDFASDEAPSFLDAAAWGRHGDLDRRDHEGIGVRNAVASVHFEDGSLMTKRSKESEGLLSMAISLEEWTRLDAGSFDASELNDRTLALLAAHNANYQNLEMAREEHNRGKGKHGKTSQGQVKSCGVMGNILTIGMLVQLRDPFRNYEPVGAPMMALMQAERVMLPPKPRLGKRLFTMGGSEEDNDLNQVTEREAVTEHKLKEPSQFKVTGIHMTGLKTGENDRKKAWGSKQQHLSGSRWLIAQGMAKTSGHSLLKSKPTSSSSKPHPGDTLWSISSQMHGTWAKWKGSGFLRSCVRNPDVVFASGTRRTR